MKRYLALPILTALHLVCASPVIPQTTISFGQTTAASIAAPGELDTHSFSAVANDRVMVSMAATSGGLDPNLELYDPQGR